MTPKNTLNAWHLSKQIFTAKWQSTLHLDSRQHQKYANGLSQTGLGTGSKRFIKNSILAGVRGIVFRRCNVGVDPSSSPDENFLSGINGLFSVATSRSNSFGSVSFMWATMARKMAWGICRKNASTTYSRIMLKLVKRIFKKLEWVTSFFRPQNNFKYFKLKYLRVPRNELLCCYRYLFSVAH